MYVYEYLYGCLYVVVYMWLLVFKACMYSLKYHDHPCFLKLVPILLNFVGQIGTNSMFILKMLVVGKGTEKRRVWHYNGSLVGFFSFVHVLPDSDAAIVVLTNSLANNDAADWIGQLLLETVLDNSEPNGYIRLAKDSADGYRDLWTSMKTKFEDSHAPDTTSRPLHEYLGSYYNKIGNWHISVELDDGNLTFKFQGRPDQVYRLKHYNYDTFSWLLTADESIVRRRWPDLDSAVYLFHFEPDNGNSVTALRWVHDWAVPDGEVFVKTPP